MRKAHIWVAGVFLQVKDLLDLLLDELIADIPLSDDAIRAWSEDPAQETTSLQTLVDCIERIERGGAIMGIDGFVSSLQYVSMYAQAMVGNADATSMAWLNGWYRPAKIYLTQPSSLQAISAMTDYLRDCPLAMDADSLSSLADLLAIAPTLPHEDETPSLVAATDEDVSLAVDDIDTDLLQALLSDAPEQLERLLEIVESFSTNTVAPEKLQEAQRIAHTLKGSGNIIGLPGIGRMAHRLEDLMDFALESARQHLDLFLHAVDLIADRARVLRVQRQEVDHGFPGRGHSEPPPVRHHAVANLDGLQGQPNDIAAIQHLHADTSRSSGRAASRSW